jgi:phosphate transport system substrate-binding protein
MNYQSIGSGGGIKQITARTVDFGASDMPLSAEELEKNGLVQWPMVMGGVVAVVNLPGVEPGQIRLTGPLLADIYLGRIKRWNDAPIAQLNGGVKLPSTEISVVRRSDGSGTTFLFAHYLAAVSPEWKSKVGVNTALEWPTGVGGKGNEGVANFVKQIVGSIGYVEYAYAKQNKLAHTQLQNAAGQFASPTGASFQAAAAGADWRGTPGMGVVLTNQPGAEAWPITGATFILMHKKQEKTEVARAALRFFDWAFDMGDAMASELDYVPMPQPVVEQVRATWTRSIVGADGKSLLSTSQ